MCLKFYLIMYVSVKNILFAEFIWKWVGNVLIIPEQGEMCIG